MRYIVISSLLLILALVVFGCLSLLLGDSLDIPPIGAALLYLGTIAGIFGFICLFDAPAPSRHKTGNHHWTEE